MRCVTYTFLFLAIIAVINGLPFTSNNGNLNGQGMLNRGLLSCYIWYELAGDPTALLARTLKPPCTIPSTFPSALLDGWSVDPGCDASKQPKTCDLHKGAYGCYRHALHSTGPGAQACYNKNGQFIADPWKGGGTLDAETPLGDVIQVAKHVFADITPFYDCCKTFLSPQPFTCNLYYEKRPTGQCENKPAV